MSDRPTWDQVCLDVAHAIARRSLCTRSQVGAVITTVDGRIHSTGYNNPARGFDHNDEPCIMWCPRASTDCQRGSAYGNCQSIHAEMNALTRSDYTEIQGGTIYVTRACCIDCAKVVGNSGLSRVVCARTDIDPQADYVEEYLRGLGIEVVYG